MNANNSPDEYLKAVHQLKQFLSESDSSDLAISHNTPKHSENKSTQSARKSLFKSSPNSKTMGADGMTPDTVLIELVQKQAVYLKTLEKELSHYKMEVPGILMEMKLLISNEESSRMAQANSLTQRLFTLLDTLSNTRVSRNHESWDSEKHNLVKKLEEAKHEIDLLNQQWASHVCWRNQPSSPNFTDDLTKEKPELQATVNKLRSTISGLQQREADALRQVQQSVEVAEQAQLERAQLENEVRRLVLVIEHHEQKVAAITSDHNRRLQDERNHWETKLADQTTLMKRENNLRDEALARLSLDLEQTQRNEAVLKNEIQIKTNLLDSSRQDFQRQLSQMQSEHSRLSGQLAELQRRLGETDLRADLSIKAAEQEVSSARTEVEFLRRKIDLLSKDFESRKQDYEQTIKELEQRNAELHASINHREDERAQAVKANSQANSLVKYLEQRERALLTALQETRSTNDEKIKELSSIIEEQRIIIQSIKEEYSSVVKDYESCLRSVK